MLTQKEYKNWRRNKLAAILLFAIWNAVSNNMLAQKEYKNWRHNKVATTLQLAIRNDVSAWRYDHKAKMVLENEEIKTLWNMKVLKLLGDSRNYMPPILVPTLC